LVRDQGGKILRERPLALCADLSASKYSRLGLDRRCEPVTVLE